MPDPLHDILSRPEVWQASRRHAGRIPAVLPTGHAALDAVLHHGGWPSAALTEFVAADCGIGEMQLLAPALAACARATRRLFFVGAPYLPYAPALQARGLPPERVLVLSPRTPKDALWSVEQILRSGACGCLLAWLPAWREADYAALRRLQIAAQQCHGPAFLFRPPGTARALSPAALRIRLTPQREELQLEILKQRGGRAGQCIAIARDAALLAPRCSAELLPVVVRGAPSADPAPMDPPLTGTPRTAPPAQPVLH
jgi:cell division inhibitor SulA/protein ImuA